MSSNAFTYSRLTRETHRPVLERETFHPVGP